MNKYNRIKQILELNEEDIKKKDKYLYTILDLKDLIELRKLYKDYEKLKQGRKNIWIFKDLKKKYGNK